MKQNELSEEEYRYFSINSGIDYCEDEEAVEKCLWFIVILVLFLLAGIVGSIVLTLLWGVY